MLKRLFAICVVLLLIGSALLMTAAAVRTYREAVAYIGAIAETEDPETGVPEAVFPLEEDGAYRIRRLEDRVELSLLGQDLTLSLELPAEDFPGTYEGLAAAGETLVRFRIDPAAYTEETVLTASEAEGDEAAAEALLERASEALPELVELTGVLCGSRDLIGELGFTAFTRHTYHDYDEGVITLEPTCVDEGVRTRTCTVCGETCTEPIPPTGIHSWDEGAVFSEATCTEAGILRFTCTVCGETRDEVIPALGHAWKLQQTTSEVQSEANPHGTARFSCSRCGSAKTAERCAGEVFTDMPKQGNWAHGPIDWAYFNGITSGKSETVFAPKAGCTRAEVVTFLWNAAGKPEPKSTVNPFQDVKSGSYYYKAVLWAVENGITAGKTATSFAPKAGCTRAEVVTFLWKAAGQPEPASTSTTFKDVKKGSYYYKAVLWAVENGITAGKNASTFDPKAGCTRAEIVTFLYRTSRMPDCPVIWSQNFPLYLGEELLESRAFCVGNRVYVDRELMEQTFGVSLAGGLQRPLLHRLGRDYVALADAAERCGLCVSFRQADSTVHLYYRGDVPWTVTEAAGDEKPAYIRLEDIMADYGLNNRFTHDQLIRIRFFGDYLRAKTDGFYIAWIPCYVNPPEGVVNNIAENFNFYNADFVFTLDSLILDGGRIGLHGYTHQDHDSVSASGYEFGSKNDLTEEEMLERFTMAEQTARALGYDWYFFEFPHYATTAFQRGVAEAHFDVIYQQYPDAVRKDQIETRTIGDHTCRWVPTPADYPTGRSGRDEFCQRLENCKNKNKLMSFFFHPYVDTRFVNYAIEGDVMTCTEYDEAANVLTEVIRLLTLWGYRLGTF